MSDMKEALVVIRSQNRMIGKLSSLLKYYGDPDWDASEPYSCEVADLLRKARRVSRKAKDMIEEEKLYYGR